MFYCASCHVNLSCPSSVYLVVRLGVNGGAALRALQGLFHLLHLDGQMGLEVSA